MASEDRRKVLVVHSSVLVHDPYSLGKFADNIIVLPIWAIEDLDKLKHFQDERGANARLVSRRLDEWRLAGSLQDGVPTESGGMIFVDYNGSDWKGLPAGLEKSNDNRILLIAKEWQKKESEGKSRKVIVVSKDINLRLKAGAMGLPAEDYKNDKIARETEGLYSGRRIIKPESGREDVWGKFISDLGRYGVTAAAPIWREMNLNDLLPNQCCQFELATGKIVLAIFKKSADQFYFVKKPRAQEDEKDVLPINFEQAFAYRLLTDPSISLVSLIGQAGTGKTLIALLAGYQQLGNPFAQILVYRPNIPLGNDIGYLPGDIDEKFAPWKQPIYDNLSLIAQCQNQQKKGRSKDVKGAGQQSLAEDLDYFKLIEVSPIVFARGRSLIDKFVIIDEAQNLTPHEVKTLISRVGQNSKLVLTGDTEQIDNPYLDSSSNGLTHVVERVKGQEIYGHIILTKGERSLLAELAATLL